MHVAENCFPKSRLIFLGRFGLYCFAAFETSSTYQPMILPANKSSLLPL